MTAIASQPLPAHGPRRTATVVSVHRPDALSGVSAAGSRLAEPGIGWRPLIIGEGVAPDRVADSPLGAGTPFVTWPRSTDPVRQVLLVRDRLRELGAAVVVPNDLPHAFIAAALDAHRGVRCAALLHGNDAMAHDLYRRCLPLADAWRAVSEPIQTAAERWAAANAPSGVLPIGLHVPDSPTPLAQPLPPTRALRLLYAGRIENMNKRAGDLAALADELHGLGARFLLTIAGDGPARVALERHLAGHIADGRVVVLGAVPLHAMRELHEVHDLAVLVSRSEGWPLVIMEAMAAGRACAITSGCGGATRLVRDGVEGVVVHTGDMRTLAARLAALASTPGLLERMGNAAHAAARASLDLRTLAPAFDTFIAECLARRQDSAASDAPRRAEIIAERWRHILAALELIGDCDPAPLCATWLADLTTPPLALHVTHDALALCEALAPIVPRITCIVSDHAIGERWMGWPVRRISDLEPGALILTRDGYPENFLPHGVLGLPLRLPGLLCPASELFLGAAARLRARGCTRLAIYGAGRHTQRIARAIEHVPEVVCVIDDRAGTAGGPPDQLWGLPVLAPADALSLGIDGVIVSSDEHEQTLRTAAARWAGPIPVASLYRE